MTAAKPVCSSHVTSMPLDRDSKKNGEKTTFAIHPTFPEQTWARIEDAAANEPCNSNIGAIREA